MLLNVQSPAILPYVQHWAQRPTLTINEAAAAMNCSRSHVYNEIRSKKLVARASRGRTIVLTSDFENYLNNLPTLTARAS
jgi:excisionase family DNA binding protein